MTANDSVKSLEKICTARTREGVRTRFHCVIPADFYGFAGHFENRPILPGVCQIQLVADAIMLTNGPTAIARIERMKFHNLIVPDTAFTLEIEPTDQGWAYRLFDGDNPFSSGKIIAG